MRYETWDLGHYGTGNYRFQTESPLLPYVDTGSNSVFDQVPWVLKLSQHFLYSSNSTWVQYIQKDLDFFR